MTGTLQPLANNFQIVDPNTGLPTDYFIRWAQQRQIDITGSISAEQAVEIIQQYLTDHQLQAGTGISLAPDGNLVNSPTISANVQAILDTLTQTRGSVIFRGAAGWQALAPGTSGYVLQTNGAGADPTWVAQSGGGGGGGLSPFWPTPPVPPTIAGAGFTLLGGALSSPQMIDTTRGVQITAVGSSGDQMALAQADMPAGDWTATALVSQSLIAANYRSVGLFLRDSTTGRITQYACSNEGPSTRRFFWNSPSSYNGQDNSRGVRYWPSVFWMRLAKVGTNVVFSLSFDGEFWIQEYSLPITDWTANPDKIGVMTVINAAELPQSREGATIMSWSLA